MGQESPACGDRRVCAECGWRGLWIGQSDILEEHLGQSCTGETMGDKGLEIVRLCITCR